MVKKFGIVLLLSQLSFASSEQSDEVTQITATPSEASTYHSPSVETIQADKAFCLATLRNPEAPIDGLSPSGKTSLQLLTLYFINNFDTRQLIQLALKRGANANIVDEHGRTPLFFVIAYTLCPEVFGEKQKELDDAPNQAQTTPALTKTEVSLDQAFSTTKNCTAQEKMHREKDTTQANQQPHRNPLHDKAVSMEVIKMFLSYKADPTHTDHQGISPLLLAITVGNQEIIDLFVEYGLLEKIFDESHELPTEHSESESNAQDDATEPAEPVVQQA